MGTVCEFAVGPFIAILDVGGDGDNDDVSGKRRCNTARLHFPLGFPSVEVPWSCSRCSSSSMSTLAVAVAVNPPMTATITLTSTVSPAGSAETLWRIMRRAM
jgi:hypothetical protein